jgi:hypothetical protein
VIPEQPTESNIKPVLDTLERGVYTRQEVLDILRQRERVESFNGFDGFDGLALWLAEDYSIYPDDLKVL